MNHDEFREYLLLQTDGVLSHDQDRLLTTHLQDCAECRAQGEFLTRFRKDLLHSSSSRLGTEGFVESVMARLPKEKSPAFGAWWKIPALVLGSLLILTMGSRLEEPSANPDSLLLLRSSSTQAQQLLRQTNVEPDDLFTLLLEDSRS